MINDLKRRARFVADDIDAWRAKIGKAIRDKESILGIHRSQFHDIELFWDGASERRERVSNILKPDNDTQIFFDKFLELGRITAGSSALLDFYMNVFAQRRDPHYKVALDDADLVAASCYQPCVELALSWGAIANETMRTPPITVLTGELSATAGTREHKMRALPTASNLHYFQDALLPIPFVFLPFDQARTLWGLCSIHHEVGHVLVQDFGLLNDISVEVDASLTQAGATGERKGYWQGWLYEVIADTFGVLLAGASYAHLLLQLLLRPPAEVGMLDEEDPHPNHYVRIHLVCALLRQLNVPALQAAADEVETAWRGLYTEPPWAAPFVKDCEVIAAVLVDKKLAQLNGHALREFAEDPAADHDKITELATALTHSKGYPYPFPRQQTFAIYRLLPPAALSAVINGGELDKVQSRVHRYIKAVKLYARPEFLAGPLAGVGAEHDDYVKGLADKLDFGFLGG
ncbi:MAG: hypothetical protein WCD37_02545 [Chloroflexia bacterium]